MSGTSKSSFVVCILIFKDDLYIIGASAQYNVPPDNGVLKFPTNQSASVCWSSKVCRIGMCCIKAFSVQLLK